MPLTYATPDDLRQALDDTDLDDARATRLLRAASALVRAHTRLARYDTTPTGAPADPDVAEAFRDATTTHAAAWVRLDVDPDLGAGAITGSAASANIGSGQVTYRTRAEQPQDKSDTLTDLVPAAALALEALTARQPLEGLTWPVRARA